jgi:hypothetical protein
MGWCALRAGVWVEFAGRAGLASAAWIGFSGITRASAFANFLRYSRI